MPAIPVYETTDLSRETIQSLHILSEVNVEGEVPKWPTLEDGNVAIRPVVTVKKFEDELPLDVEDNGAYVDIPSVKSIPVPTPPPAIINEVCYFFSGTHMSYTIESGVCTIRTDYSTYLVCQFVKFPPDIESVLVPLVLKFREMMDECPLPPSKLEQRLNYLRLGNMDVPVESLLCEEKFKVELAKLKLIEDWHKFLSFSSIGVPKSISRYIRRYVNYISWEKLVDLRPAVFDLEREFAELRAKIQRQVWSISHINFGKFEEQLEAMDPDSQGYLLTIIRYFSQVDVVLVKTLLQKLSSEMDVHEMNLLWAEQEQIEGVHAEVYGQFLKKSMNKHKLKLGERMIYAIERINQLLEFLSQDGIPVEITLYGAMIVEGLLLFAQFLMIDVMFRDNHVANGFVIVDAIIAANLAIIADEITHILISKLALRLKKKLPSKAFRVLLLDMCQGILFDIVAESMVKFKNSKVDFAEMMAMFRLWGHHLLKHMDVESPPFKNEKVEKLLKTIVSTIMSPTDVAFLEQDNNNYIVHGTISAKTCTSECASCTL